MKNLPALMSRPLISIITVNLNDLEGLKRTFKSVFNQIWLEFEYIVIDGGSNDGSAEYISSQGSSIDYWLSEPDSGIYNAMNKGIRAANGEYLLFLNSGDELINPEVLKKNHNHLKDKDVYYFNISIVEGKNTQLRRPPEKIDFSYLYKDNIHHQSVLIKKRLFDEIGYYDEELHIVSDWKFFIIAFYKFNATFEYIDETLSIFYRGGVSSNYTKLLLEREKVMSSDFKMISNDIKEFVIMKRLLMRLRNSRNIKVLIKLGLINKF